MKTAQAMGYISGIQGLSPEIFETRDLKNKIVNEKKKIIITVIIS